MLQLYGNSIKISSIFRKYLFQTIKLPINQQLTSKNQIKTNKIMLIGFFDPNANTTRVVFIRCWSVQV